MTAHAQRLAALRSEPSTDAPGDPARLARIGRTREEMLAQGAAIATTLGAEADAVATLAHTLKRRRIDRVVIAGCGDSWHVGTLVRPALEQCFGVPIEAAQAFDYAQYGAAHAGPGTLVFGLSSGGNTPAVMAALANAGARGAFAVGVSNTPGSPVLRQFDAGLLVHATRRGWPTQSSTAAAALLLALGAALADAPALHQAITALPGAMGTWLDAPMAPVAQRWAAAREIFLTGAGPYLGTAAIGAAKLRELSPIHAHALPLEEMHHYRLPKAGDHLVIIAADAESRERAFDTALVARAVGAQTVALLHAPDPELAALVETAILLPAAPAATRPILACLPLHAFAWHFAVARDAHDQARA
jgi:glucosamine--fructose-6-phosphate aminotransferase (isomerizing)